MPERMYSRDVIPLTAAASATNESLSSMQISQHLDARNKTQIVSTDYPDRVTDRDRPAVEDDLPQQTYQVTNLLFIETGYGIKALAPKQLYFRLRDSQQTSDEK